MTPKQIRTIIDVACNNFPELRTKLRTFSESCYVIILFMGRYCDQVISLFRFISQWLGSQSMPLSSFIILIIIWLSVVSPPTFITLQWISNPSRGSSNTPTSCFMMQKPKLSTTWCVACGRRLIITFTGWLPVAKH